MSQKRKQKQAKQNKRRNQRAHMAGQRPPSIEQLAFGMVADSVEELVSGDPVDAELVASDLVAGQYARLLELPPEELEHAALPATAVVRMLANHFNATGDINDAALALTLALRSMDPADKELQVESTALADRLRADGATDPEWGPDAGQYEITECWTLRDVWCAQSNVVVGFKDARGNEHSLSVFTSRESWDQVEDLVLSVPIAEWVERVRTSLDRDEAHDLSVLEQLTPGRAAALVAEAREGMWETGGEALRESEMAFDLVGLLEARWALLAPVFDAASDEERFASPLASDLDELALDQLRTRFWDSEHRAAEPSVTVESAEALTAWVASDAVPLRAQFSPEHAAEYLLDIAAPAAFAADDVETVLVEDAATARAWTRFTHAQLGLPDRAVEIVLDTIAQLDEQYLQIALGPAEPEDDADDADQPG